MLTRMLMVRMSKHIEEYLKDVAARGCKCRVLSDVECKVLLGVKCEV